MSEKYLPLFRKYRPQSFKDVVGQESLVKALSNAIELNRIANAYLFAGPRGTGKTSCARIFAKSLNCSGGPTLEPCQKCPSCLDITNASGLDVIEIDAATNRGIDDAKELIAQTQYAPMNGKYKIFIIDEVHMLSNEAFNALLKTFEEPPANVIFILATTEPHKVIETIVSRCQRFDLRRITIDDITKRLREISDIEGIKITDDALYTIAKNVSGGLRDSLALLDQVSILGAREEITKDVIENLLGKVTFDVAFGFLDKILSKNIENALSSLDEIYNKGLEPKNFCENFIEFLRNLIFALKSNDDKNTLKFTNFNQNNIDIIKAANLDAPKIFRILEKVVEYYKEIRFTTNPYLWTELLVINLCKDETAIIQAAPAMQTIPDTKAQPITNISTVAQPKAKPAMPDLKPSETITSPKTTAEPAANAGSIVRNTLKEMQIPDSAPVTETVDDGVQSVGEYKEALYEEPVREPIKDLPQKESEKSDMPAMPDVPTDENTANEAIAARETKPAEQDIPLPQKPVENIPTMPDVPTTLPTQNNGVTDPAATWASVLNVIESIPAKFFYSGVGKLISVANNKITLGFVNENAINQAKSESKYKHLMKAIQNILGEGYCADFILITPETKVMDVKLTPKFQEKPRPSYASAQIPAQPAQNIQNIDSLNANIAQNTRATEYPAAERPIMPDVPGEIQEDNQDSKGTLSNYGRKTREMLEAFNGKVIE